MISLLVFYHATIIRREPAKKQPQKAKFNMKFMLKNQQILKTIQSNENYSFHLQKHEII